MLAEAENPMIVSGYAGLHHENVQTLITLAETLGANVLTGYSFMNFPTDHPLCLGIEQIGGSRKSDPGYDEADVILAVDYMMPYVGSAPPPKEEAKILHIDVDPYTVGRLLWGRGADIFVKADSREALPKLIELIKAKITSEKADIIKERAKSNGKKNDAARKGWYDAARLLKNKSPISPDYLCYCINELIEEDDIVVNHTLTHCASPTEQIVRTKPGTWFGCPSGAIGWATGAALGASAASPGRAVVAILSDGGFVWGCPTASLWMSKAYEYPVLYIICNNIGYGAVRTPQRELVGTDKMTENFTFESAEDFMPDYSAAARGAGAYGKRVEKSEDVMSSLEEALAAVRGGLPAVLDVRFGREY